MGIKAIATALISEDSNYCYEYYGDRVRVTLGNLARSAEQDSGYRSMNQFQIDFEGAGEVGEFDHEEYDHANQRWKLREHYLSRSFSIVIWRYGFAISWRGKPLPEDWGVPRWHYGKDGRLLEDYR